MKRDGYPYEVLVIGADGNSVEPNATGHVGLAHGEKYKVRITNYSGAENLGAHISIDGQDVGGFLVRKNEMFETDRGAKNDQQFTFFQDNTAKADEHGFYGIADNDKGLIAVKIVPEVQEVIKPTPLPPPSFGDDYGLGLTRGGGSFGLRGGGFNFRSFGADVTRGGGNTRGFSAGATGFEGKSGLRFRTVEFNGDEARAYTFNLRLAFDPERKLDATLVAGQTASPVPAPISEEKPDLPSGGYTPKDVPKAPQVA